MSKKLSSALVFLLAGFTSFAQLYTKPVYPQGYFRWPTNLKPDIVANMGELRPNHWHMGLDVRTNGQVNQNIYAAADGYIAFVGIEPLSWGRWIIINHPNGLSTLYGHLNNFRDDLEQYVTEHQYNTQSWETHLTIPPGRFPVKKGDFISFSGTTGGSAGPHVHWEVIDTKSGKRLNPSLFGTPITDNVPPTVLKIAMYDRNNSVYDQSPSIYKLSKINGVYTVAGGHISTALNKLSFSIQAYDTRNGTANQDGIYSARLYFDNREISSFYIDSIDYDDTRYVNCQVDYKMMSGGGAWMQHTSKLPGDYSGIYYDLGQRSLISLLDTMTHNVRIDVADASENISSINFNIVNNGALPPAVKTYEWFPGTTNQLLNANFEAHLGYNALYDKMYTNYSGMLSTASNSVSSKYKLGETYIPVHSNFEVRIRPNKSITSQERNCIVIKRTGKTSTVKRAVWNGEWLTAQFRDFGTFEAFIDNVPPTINSLGSGEVINLNKATRIAFTPADNFGIAEFRAEVDGQWLRFTNDKGRTWIYNFDSHIVPGQHTLTVTVRDIAGNITRRSWQFIRGVNPPPATVEYIEEKPAVKKAVKEVPKSNKHTINNKKEAAKKATTKDKKKETAVKGKEKTAAKVTPKKTEAASKKQSTSVKKAGTGKVAGNKNGKTVEVKKTAEKNMKTSTKKK